MTATTTQAADLWADGALTVPAAVRFSGVCRTRLFVLMRDGVLPWSRNGTHRLIPRRALVAYLAGLEPGKARGRA